MAVYARPVTSRPGTPLITRLARRYAGAMALRRSGDWAMEVRGANRMAHVFREADAAGITEKQLRAEVKRLEVS